MNNYENNNDRMLNETYLGVGVPNLLWKFITSEMVPNINPMMYMISNHGHVMNYVERNVKSPTLTKDGSLYIGVYRTDGTVKGISVSRLVAMAFVPLPPNTNIDDLYIMHLNGNKQDNRAENLIWATKQEHYKVARQDKGIPLCNNNFTEAQVLFIADRLMENMTYGAICELMGMDPTPYNMQIISKIKTKYTYANVTANYDFSNYTGDRRLLSDADVHNICKILVDIKNSDRYYTPDGSTQKFGAREIMTELGKSDYYNSLNKRDKQALVKAISGIKCKKTYKDITSQYDF